MKIRPVVADLFHTDGRTDGRTDTPNEANSSFSKFCERAEKSQIHMAHRTQGQHAMQNT
jgi:hypothetical protein